MCSQPIVHEAQLLRAMLRMPARSSAASRGASANVDSWTLRVASGADRGDAPRLAQPGAQALLGVGRGQAPEVAGVLDARAVAIDEQGRRLRARAAHDDRVVAGELAGDGEVAGGERVVEHAGQ